MTFTLTPNSAEDFIQHIAALCALTEEATLNLTDTGIFSTECDPSQTALIHLYIPKNQFNTYQISHPQKIALNTAKLYEYLKRTNPTDKLTLKTTPEGLLQLQVNSDIDRDWTLPLMIPRKDTPTTTPIDYKVTAHFNTQKLIQRLDDLALAGDFITITATADKLKFSTKGDLSYAHILIPNKNDALNNLTVTEPTKASYSLNYLKTIAKTAQTKPLTAQFTTDYPLKLSVQLEEGYIVYWLAHRLIEQHEETTP